MPGLLQGEHLYIAQPPLYRVAAGREGRWIYSDRERDRALLEFTLRDVTLTPHPNGSKASAKPVELHRHVDALNALRAVLRELDERSYSRPVLFALVNKVPLDDLEGTDFTSRKAVDALARQIKGLPGVNSAEIAGDEAAGFRVEVLNGDAKHAAVLDSAFVHGGMLRRLYEAYSALAELVSGTVIVARKDKEIGKAGSVAALTGLVDSLIEQGVRGLTVQRYKGLGEMNPEQLWESTMNPETRTLLKVDVADQVDADRVFQTLMGEEVQPRKDFIHQYAKMVKNLDI